VLIDDYNRTWFSPLVCWPAKSISEESQNSSTTIGREVAQHDNGANAGSATVVIELHTMAEAHALQKKSRTGTRTTSATAPVASSKKDRVGLAD
jgi:hypothetical protein